MALSSRQIHRLDRVRIQHMGHVVGCLQIIQIQVGEPIVVLLHSPRYAANAVPHGHGLPVHHVTETVLHAKGIAIDVRVMRLEAVRHGILRRALLVTERRRCLRLLRLHLLPVVFLVVQPAEHPLIQLQEQRKDVSALNAAAPWLATECNWRDETATHAPSVSPSCPAHGPRPRGGTHA